MRKSFCVLLVLCVFFPLFIPSLVPASSTIKIDSTITLDRGEDGASSIEIGDLAIEELNLLTSGEVKILSLSPLSIEVRINAGEVAVGPLISLLKDLSFVPQDFMEGVGIRKMAAKELLLLYTKDTLQVEALEISYDESVIKGLYVSYSLKDKDVELKADSANLLGIPFDLKKAVPDIGFIHIEKPSLVKKGPSIALQFSSLTLDQHLFEGADIFFDQNQKQIDLKIKDAEIDLEDIHRKAMQDPNIKKTAEAAFQKAKIAGLTPHGKLRITDLAIAGSLDNIGLMDASGAVSGRNNTLDIIFSQTKPERLIVKIDEMGLSFQKQDEQIGIQLDSLVCNSSLGGKAALKGRFGYPFIFKDMVLEGTIENLVYADYKINATLNHKEKRQFFEAAVDSPGFNILTDGSVVFAEGLLDVNLGRFHFTSPKPPSAESPSEDGRGKVTPIDLAFLTGKDIKGKVHIEDLRYNEYSTEGIDIGFELKDDKGFVQATAGYCFCNLGITALLSMEEGIFYDMALEGHDIDLPLFIGCFISELPVYLTGKMDLRLYASGNGKTPKGLEESVKGEVTVSIQDGQVIRLSHLDSRLKFVLDILQRVRLNPSKLEDTLPFDKFYLRGEISRQELKIPEYFMNSPIIDVYGDGNVALEEKRLKLKGEVSFKKIKKSFDIEQNLKEKGEKNEEKKD